MLKFFKHVSQKFCEGFSSISKHRFSLAFYPWVAATKVKLVSLSQSKRAFDKHRAWPSVYPHAHSFQNCHHCHVITLGSLGEFDMDIFNFETENGRSSMLTEGPATKRQDLEAGKHSGGVKGSN